MTHAFREKGGVPLENIVVSGCLSASMCLLHGAASMFITFSGKGLPPREHISKGGLYKTF